MDLINIFVLLTTAINLVYCVILRYHTKKSESHAYFFHLAIALFAWCLTMMMYRLADQQWVVFWTRLLYFSASFVPSTFLLFSIAYPDKKLNNIQKFAVIIPNVIVAALCLFGNTMIEGVTVIKNSENIIHFGKLYYILYQLYTPALFLASFVILIRKALKARGLLKAQLSYILIGVIVTSSIAMVTNLILPTIKIFTYNWVGQVSTIIWVSFVSYAILRHRLLEIEYVFSKIIFTLISAIPAYVFYFTLAGIFESIWDTSLHIVPFIIGWPISFLFVTITRYLYTKVELFVSGNILYSGQDPFKSYIDFTQKVNNMNTLDQIVQETASHFDRIFTIRYTDLVPIVQDQPRSLVLKKELSAEINEPLKEVIQFWREKELSSITIDDVSHPNSEISYPKEARLIMEKLDLSLLVPLYIKKNIIGVVFVGKRKDNRLLDNNALRIIDDYLSTLTLAIQRGTLYKELQQANISLEKRVKKATKQLRNRNKELQDLYSNLEELYQKEKDLMDIAGHELRTPASILKTNLYLLRNRLTKLIPEPKDEKLEKYLERLTESTDRQIKLVNTFLESARIENKKFSLNFETADFTNLISDAVEENQYAASTKSLKIIFKPPKSKIYVDMDEVRMREVIDNLLTNAIKYTKEGYIEVSISETEDTVSCQVKDTGIGIKEEDMPALFKRFSRVETHIGGKEEKLVRPGGTGLGLYVSKNIIDSHNGTIDVKSEFGKGSTFTFTIPKHQKIFNGTNSTQ